MDLVRTRGGKVDNIWGGGFQQAGISDLLICYKGRHIAAELKVGYNKATPLQVEYLYDTVRAGGLAVLVKDKPDELMRILDLIDEGEENENIQSTVRLPERSNQGVGRKKQFGSFPRYGSGEDDN